MSGIRGLTGWVGTVLDSRDPVALGAFYSALLGWDHRVVDPSWVTMGMRDEGGARINANLAFQLDPAHVDPVWPACAGDPQMQLHLDIGVTDLQAAVDDALAVGARLAGHQPQRDVRVLLDPDGHPFCLYLSD